MKKYFSIFVLMLVFIYLYPTNCYADGFSDIFASITHYDANLDHVTNNCIIQPTPEAINAYAIDNHVLLPCLTKEGDVLTLGLLMKGTQSLEHPTNMRIYTESKVYTFIPSKANPTQTMIPITLARKSYNICMLPSYAYHVLSDIASSNSVSVSYCANSSFTGATTFTLDQNTINAFKAVDTVLNKYLSVGEDGSKMYSGMDFLAEMMMEFSEDTNNSSMWN